MDSAQKEIVNKDEEQKNFVQGIVNETQKDYPSFNHEKATPAEETPVNFDPLGVGEAVRETATEIMQPVVGGGTIRGGESEVPDNILQLRLHQKAEDQGAEVVLREKKAA